MLLVEENWLKVVERVRASYCFFHVVLVAGALTCTTCITSSHSRCTYCPSLIRAALQGGVGGAGEGLGRTALVDAGPRVKGAKLAVDGGLGEVVVAQRVGDLDGLEGAAARGVDADAGSGQRRGDGLLRGPVPVRGAELTGGLLVLSADAGGIQLGQAGSSFDEALLGGVMLGWGDFSMACH